MSTSPLSSPITMTLACLVFIFSFTSPGWTDNGEKKLAPEERKLIDRLLAEMFGEAKKKGVTEKQVKAAVSQIPSKVKKKILNNTRKRVEILNQWRNLRRQSIYPVVNKLQSLYMSQAKYKYKHSKYGTLDELAKARLISPQIAKGKLAGHLLTVKVSSDGTEFTCTLTHPKKGRPSFYLDHNRKVRCSGDRVADEKSPIWYNSAPYKANRIQQKKLMAKMNQQNKKIQEAVQPYTGKNKYLRGLVINKVLLSEDPKYYYHQVVAPLLKSRIDANESAAQATVRSIVSAQKQFFLLKRKKVEGKAVFGSLKDLVKDNMISSFESGVKGGYKYTLTLGKDGQSFEVIAEPISDLQGIKKFYSNEKGNITFTEDGSTPTRKSRPVE